MDREMDMRFWVEKGEGRYSLPLNASRGTLCHRALRAAGVRVRLGPAPIVDELTPTTNRYR